MTLMMTPWPSMLPPPTRAGNLYIQSERYPVNAKLTATARLLSAPDKRKPATLHTRRQLICPRLTRAGLSYVDEHRRVIAGRLALAFLADDLRVGHAGGQR